ncbi:phage/plasmid primase, P4 family [Methylobacterium radiodurans]|nr:phage/plasmid primase, P4 family [Methylobacterium radiodurans]
MRTETYVPFPSLPRPAAEARRAVQHGLSVVPLKPRSKVPSVPHGIDDAISTRMGVRAHARAHQHDNYGLILDGEIFAVDVDGPEGEKSLQRLIGRSREFPATVETITARGRQFIFRARPGRPVRSSCGRHGPGIDIKGQRGYVVLPGSVHPLGPTYRSAPGRALGEIAIAQAPDWLLDLVVRSPDAERVRPLTEPLTQGPDATRTVAYAAAALKSELNALSRATVGKRNSTLNKAAYVLGALCQPGVLDEAEVRARLTETALAVGLTAEATSKTIASGMRAGRLEPRNLGFLADPGAAQPGAEAVIHDPVAAKLAELGETDADNGHRFARRFRNEVAYVPSHGLLVWNGKIWEPAADTAALRRAEECAHAIAHEAAYLNDGKLKASREAFSKASLSKGALERAIFLARSHLETPLSRFDAEPYLLSVANGTLDLRTGTLGPHDPAHRLTRLTPIVYDEKARCPVFERFLRQRLGHEPELIAFLQKAVGLTLTGVVSEQVLFFLQGEGGTGKSTFVNLIRELLGSFAVHTPVESFTTKQFEPIRTDLARMAGARMVTAGEIHPSQQFDEAAIKGLTGGDPITARFMRQDLIQFMPQFKLWLYANHFPKVRATDNAFWRRIRVLPFINVVPEGTAKKGLPERLRAELPGVLNWAVAGCLAWQREGLEPPNVVRAATEAWRHGADHVSRYLRERTVQDIGARVGATDLHSDFGAWCTAAGEQPVSLATFKARLIALGRVSRKTNKGHFWIGLRLRG